MKQRQLSTFYLIEIDRCNKVKGSITSEKKKVNAFCKLSARVTPTVSKARGLLMIVDSFDFVGKLIKCRFIY